ncbi:MAG: hypothetical protein QOD02_3332 [Mycobacterium sp.]|jgi:hypothetical protein|nr:hypothetical protein [Mycobacterium sp.]MDT5278817.1 hypothetical protein [Mycobacterium sp.]MDT5317700.1 hypothetical protein [Mycobacterium sp.]
MLRLVRDCELIALEPRSWPSRRHHTGLTLTAYSAEPDTPTHDALTLLASWAATLDQSSQQESV